MNENNILEIKDLHVSVEGKEILNGINLLIKKGEVHAIMGPNGSGKSTLANAIMGHPKFEVTRGSVLFEGKNLEKLSADKRAKLGLFLSFQHPLEIPGLKFKTFLRSAFNSVSKEKLSFMDFNKLLEEKMKVLALDGSLINRSLNEGFSGGEKKKAEILQMLILNPKLALLDETDSGLDIDSLKLICESINSLKKEEFSGLIITHYKRILTYLKPDFVHVLSEGKIVKSRGHEFADEIEEKGFSWLAKETTEEI